MKIEILDQEARECFRDILCISSHFCILDFCRVPSQSLPSLFFLSLVLLQNLCEHCSGCELESDALVYNGLIRKSC